MKGGYALEGHTPVGNSHRATYADDASQLTEILQANVCISRRWSATWRVEAEPSSLGVKHVYAARNPLIKGTRAAQRLITYPPVISFRLACA